MLSKSIPYLYALSQTWQLLPSKSLSTARILLIGLHERSRETSLASRVLALSSSQSCFAYPVAPDWPSNLSLSRV